MMRKRLTMVALLALALLLVPVRAYADFSLDFFGNGNIWTGRVNDTNFGAFTRANDIYDAAVYAIGQDPITLSSEVRSKLSDPNHGGHFYEFAQSFVNLEGTYDLPEWLPVYMVVMIPNFPDWPRYWKAEVPYSLRTNAETDFKRVLAGEDLGGGSSPQVYHLYSMDAFANSNAYAHGNESAVSFNAVNATFSDGSIVTGSGTTRVSAYMYSAYYYPSGKVYVNTDTLVLANSYISQGYDVVFFFDVDGHIGFVYGSGLAVERIKLGSDFVNGVTGSDKHVLRLSSTLYFDEVPFASFPSSYSPSFSSSNGNIFYSYYSSVFSTPFDVSVPPGGTWPEPVTPVTPTAPEQPTPTAPTVTPDPTITEPTPTWPQIPTPTAPTVTLTDTPEGLDYTQLLTLINDNLNDINSYTVAINSNLNSLRSDLVTEFESVEQGLKNIYQYLQHFDSLLERHCKHLRDALDDGIYNLELYLKRLFEWLPQQLNFDANFDYDDSSIQTLLRRILTKIPGTSSGLPNDTMPNPVADEPGFFDWLSDLWHRFLIDLVSVLPDELGGLVDAFSQLTHYFPFSIPWDLAALLALFEHEPVTPVFDVPWGFGGGDGDVEMVHIDLSPWDGVMQMVRPVFVVGFCWQLAMITKDLLSGFDINKGGV